MKISTKGRYAIEALVYMSTLDPTVPINTKSLADATQIPQKYLEQIFFVLRKNNILATKRGPNGGYLISKEIGDLTAGDILSAVEEDVVPVACVKNPDSCSSKVKNVCVTRNLWTKVYNAIDEVLFSVTLEDLKNAYIETKVSC